MGKEKKKEKITKSAKPETAKPGVTKLPAKKKKSSEISWDFV